jgi:hypothetical protein
MKPSARSFVSKPLDALPRSVKTAYGVLIFAVLALVSAGDVIGALTSGDFREVLRSLPPLLFSVACAILAADVSPGRSSTPDRRGRASAVALTVAALYLVGHAAYRFWRYALALPLSLQALGLEVTMLDGYGAVWAVSDLLLFVSDRVCLAPGAALLVCLRLLSSAGRIPAKTMLCRSARRPVVSGYRSPCPALPGPDAVRAQTTGRRIYGPITGFAGVLLRASSRRKRTGNAPGARRSRDARRRRGPCGTSGAGFAASLRSEPMTLCPQCARRRSR